MPTRAVKRVEQRHYRRSRGKQVTETESFSEWWALLRPYQRLRYASSAWLLGTLLILLLLSLFRTTPVVRLVMGLLFLAFGGAPLYLLVGGIVGFEILLLIDGIRKRPFRRGWFLCGGLAIWLCFSGTCQLLWQAGGWVGEQLASPFHTDPSTGTLLFLSVMVVLLVLLSRPLLCDIVLFLRVMLAPPTTRITSQEVSSEEASRPSQRGMALFVPGLVYPPEEDEGEPGLYDDSTQVLPELPRKETGSSVVSSYISSSMSPLPHREHIRSRWAHFSTDLLNTPATVKPQRIAADAIQRAVTLQKTLDSFRVWGEVRQADMSIGPTIVRFGIRPTGTMRDPVTEREIPVKRDTPGIPYEKRTRVSRIMNLQNDIALALEAPSIRMLAPVPGRPYVGVEIPNKNSRIVTLREVLESQEYQQKLKTSRLTIALGRDVAGKPVVANVAGMPHALIAGATGAGKSAFMNALTCSLLYNATPDHVRLLMIDPKMVELSVYNGIPHLLMPVITEVDKVVPLLKRAISEMERRYRLFSQLGVRNLDGYRKMRRERLAKGDDSLNNLPAIVIIIDELADLMMAAPEEVEGLICRLAQLARATGIHLVIATQRPSVDVITGLIKANIPTRISFMVSSSVDSRTIIDMGGAERLLGRGDMLYLPADAGQPERIQGAFVADEETMRIVNHWKAQAPATEDSSPWGAPGWELPSLPDDATTVEQDEPVDDLLDQAEGIVRDYGRGSISLLQRRLRIGYSRAARLIDLLEERGVIGQAENGGRGRSVLGQSNTQAEADEIFHSQHLSEGDERSAEE
jgi:hypothetical protein